MLSWEYPPVVVGGLGRHVDALSRELAAAGSEVDLITGHAAGQPGHANRGKVEVLRAAADELAIDFDTESLLAWAATHDHALLRTALPRVATHPPDVVHAHDWLVGQSAVTLAQTTGVPLVLTIHATERGRNRGLLTTPLRRAIDSVERWLARQADRVIVCSRAMHAEVVDGFDLPADRVQVIGNGVDVAAWTVGSSARALARTSASGPLIAVAGRLEWEKGVQTVIDALPRLRRRHPGLTLAVAGSGSYEPQLRQRAERRRVTGAVRWLGHTGDRELAGLLAAADVAVVPSLYEPFGLVALEAAAAGVPRVVSQVGGLAELVSTGRSGLTVPPGDVAATAAAISMLLDDPTQARRLAMTARRELPRRFSWQAVAAATVDVYQSVLDS